MADTASNSKLRPTIWAKEMYAEAMADLFFVKNKLMGPDINNIIQTQDDLKKQPGEKVIFGLVYNLKGDGVVGDSKLEDNEEAVVTKDFEILIDQVRNAVRTTGRLDDQKSMFKTRSSSKELLKTWLTEFLERQIFLKLASVGQAALKDVNGVVYSARYAWSNTPVLHTLAELTAGKGDRYYNARPGVSLSALETYDVITPAMITAIKAKAKMSKPKIKPIKYNGKDMYFMFVHPWQFAELVKNPKIYTAWKDAQNRGDSNPIFAGADSFEWDGVVVVSHEFTPYLKPGDVTYANFEGIAGAAAQAKVAIARAIFVGRQAGCYARTDNSDLNAWVEETFDYGNKTGTAAAIMGGVAKSVFDGKDFATIVLDTAVNEPTFTEDTPAGLQCAKPTATPTSGEVTSGDTVTLACATSGAVILYTLDGSAPTFGSSVYSAPIALTAAKTIKAMAVKSGFSNSEIMSESYTIAE